MFHLLCIPDTAEASVDCFIHEVTPVTKAQSGNRKYFNCTLQTQDDVVRAVCFSPEKRSEFKTVSKTKSPVKLKKITTTDGCDIRINKNTTITPLDKDKLPFQFCDELTADSNTRIPLSSIYKLAAEQLITVKAKVVTISAVKVFASNNGRLQKQEVMITDPTASMKLVLWGSYVNTLQPDQTYKFETFRVKEPKADRYLNTPKTDNFTATTCEPFDQPLIEVEQDLEQLASSTITAQVVGIKTIYKTFACLTCKKKSVFTTRLCFSNMSVMPFDSACKYM
jgi:hypothetical protein